ncbi:MAG: hypothetical protein CBR30_08125 [Dictyoglomus sp. NZ13-RE01]|nr:MAG: hypothetical protein CBR30_08125 [Dictyoglomus sp. NZ13-RE01]
MKKVVLILFFLIFLVIVGEGNIENPQSLSYVDWSKISPLVVVSNPLESLKAIQANDTLYILIKSKKRIDDKKIIVYIDTNPLVENGAVVSIWNDVKGIKYKSEDESLYKFNVDKNNWEKLNEKLKIAKKNNVAEIAIPLNAIGIFDSRKIKIGISIGDEYFLPEPGTPMFIVDKPTTVFGPSINVTIDGNGDDWKDIKPMYTSQSGAKLFAGIKNGVLYALIIGEMGDWNDLFLDVDGNPETGFLSWAWKDFGGDYLIENGLLYKSLSAGWAWQQIEGAKVEWKESGTNPNRVIELAFPLSELKIEDIKNLRIAFSGGNTNLPDPGISTEIVKVSIPEVTLDNNDNEWIMVPPTATGNGNIRKVIAIKSGNVLKTLIKGNFEHVGFYLDITPSDREGIKIASNIENKFNYMVKDGKLFASKDMNWEEIKNVSIKWVQTKELAKAEIDLSKLVDKISDLKLLFFSESPYEIFPQDRVITPLNAEEGFKVEIDGDDKEWDGITQEVKSSNTEFKLSAVTDDRKLYIRIDGARLNTNNVIYISTGGNIRDYKIERNSLYKYNSNSWKRIGEVWPFIDANYVEYEVNLKQLGLTDNMKDISLSAIIKDVIYLPERNSNPVKVTGKINRERDKNTFYPYEIFDTLYNPLMGSAPWAKFGETGYKHTLAFINVSWKELEPEKGVYKWQDFERKNKFDYWTKKGVRFVFRLYLDEPGMYKYIAGKKSMNDLDIPIWLYKEIKEDGTWYRSDLIGGGGFSPNYENEILIREHERLLKALAEKYGKDDRIAFIEIGSLGHWGELHTWPDGTGKFPSIEVVNRYIKQYIDAFPNKILGLRKPYKIMENYKLGLYNDMFGDKGATEEWVNWFTYGREDEEGNLTKPMPDFWKYAYSGGEFAYGDAYQFLTDDTIAETLRQARISHTTFIGPCSALDVRYKAGAITNEGDPLPEGHPIKENIDIFHKTLGYRFVLEAIKHEKEINRGDLLNLEMLWNNRGVAPFYFKWPVEISLANTKGEVVYRFILEDFDIRNILPGVSKVYSKVRIPKEIQPGNYTLLISINDPKTNNPAINLAIEGRRSDGRFQLDSITIK